MLWWGGGWGGVGWWRASSVFKRDASHPLSQISPFPSFHFFLIFIWPQLSSREPPSLEKVTIEPFDTDSSSLEFCHPPPLPSSHRHSLTDQLECDCGRHTGKNWRHQHLRHWRQDVDGELAKCHEGREASLTCEEPTPDGLEPHPASLFCCICTNVVPVNMGFKFPILPCLSSSS